MVIPGAGVFVRYTYVELGVMWIHMQWGVGGKRWGYHIHPETTSFINDPLHRGKKNLRIGEPRQEAITWDVPQC